MGLMLGQSRGWTEMNHLYIIRGLPGSGKSTFVHEALPSDILLVEADQFFMTEFGEYIFDPNKLPEAHEWCYNTVINFLNFTDVAVANTFSRIWEMQKYLGLPNPKTVITVEGNYPNIHGVPDSVIQKMKDRWEKY